MNKSDFLIFYLSILALIVMAHTNSNALFWMLAAFSTICYYRLFFRDELEMLVVALMIILYLSLNFPLANL